MTRSRVPKESPKVALFPFLEVLICTMGSLILLLVIIARQAKLQTERADEGSLLAAAESREKLAALDEHNKMLRMIKQDGEQELVRRRAALQEIESQARTLIDELTELTAAQALLSGSQTAEQNTQRQRELARLKSRIEQLQRQLAETRKKVADADPSYAIVPYHGPNQTRRRPIYIECRRDAIVLEPEGIVLTAADFEGPLGPGNPLAAGVRAAEQYLGRSTSIKQQDEAQPYPLLLVRPDGINSYYVARAALKSWGSDFGYELIEQDWQLEYQAKDTALATVEERAVQEGRERQRALAMAVAMRGGRGPGGGNGASSSAAGGPSFADRVENDDEHSRASYRVAADGRIVRDRAASQAPASRHGSSLSRYADIVGEAAERQQLSNSARSEASANAAQAGSARPAYELPPPAAQSERSAESPRIAGAQGGSTSQRSGMNAPASPSAGMTSTSPAGPASDVAVATDQQGPRILPQQMFGRHEQTSGHSLAATHGKNWALPDASRGSLPVTRPIRVECRSDGLTIRSEYAGGPPAKMIPFSGDTANSVDALVTAIWERMEGWGIAGKGLYWRPELHIATAPGGEGRLNDLRTLLADSGLVIHDRTEGPGGAVR
jgi:ElaB/YqjD/DUF883 family membrane-anchored ribosome-binding protein